MTIVGALIGAVLGYAAGVVCREIGQSEAAERAMSTCIFIGVVIGAMLGFDT